MGIGHQRLYDQGKGCFSQARVYKNIGSWTGVFVLCRFLGV